MKMKCWIGCPTHASYLRISTLRKVKELLEEVKKMNKERSLQQNKKKRKRIRTKNTERYKKT